MISHGVKVAAPVDPAIAERTQLVDQQLWANLAKLLGLGAGAGLAFRGAQGLYNVGRRAMTPPRSFGPTTITVPLQEEEEGPPKTASGPAAATSPAAPGFLDGSWATNWTGHPLAMPLSVAAVGGGALGGWKLMDYVLDKRRKEQMKAELDTAKQQYEQALLGAYDKQGSALGHDLDHLFALLTKEADWVDGDLVGQGVGTALTGAGAIALASGVVAHNIASKRRKADLLQKAIRKRRREQAMVSPSRIFAIPEPLPSAATSMQTAPTEEDLSGQPLDKVAHRVSQSLIPGAR